MAVVDKYVNANQEPTATRRRTAAQNAQGGAVTHIVQTFETVAADDDLSVFRVFANIPASAIFLNLRLACDAITGATDYDCGLYLPNDGDVIDKDCLADGMNISAGYSRILALDALVTVDLAACNKSLWEIARDAAGAAAAQTAYTVQNHPKSFDICLTANTAGSGAATITMFGSYFLAS